MGWSHASQWAHALYGPKDSPQGGFTVGGNSLQLRGSRGVNRDGIAIRSIVLLLPRIWKGDQRFRADRPDFRHETVI